MRPPVPEPSPPPPGPAAPAAGPGPYRAAGRTAVVVGGGIAGTAAALALADAGVRVTLTEARPRLGGLAFSFRRSSPAGDLTADNGQHVHLRCCTAYRALLERVGAAGLAPVQPRLDVPVLDAARNRAGRLRRSALPVPLHLAGSLARYPHLSPAERAAAARAALALRRLDPADPALDGTDFGGWLRRQGQSPRAVEALWDLIGVATLNAPADRASLALAAMVFRTGLLSAPGAADIGRARVPLGELHDTRTRRALEGAGVRVLLRTRARALHHRDAGSGGWRVAVTAPGGPETLRADTVVLAVPQDEAHRLLPDGALDDPGRLLDIGTAPILNVHVVYDRRVLRRPFLAALGSPVQWVFDRTEPSGLTGGAQYLALSQSAAGDIIDLPVAELRRRFLPELERLLPGARNARVADFFVTRERAATFDPAPGTGRLRPPARTRAPGLQLAGAWTATGWPATMEGAARSGATAAAAALRHLRTVRTHPDPPPGPGRVDPQQEAA
ncbi:hydroxysqualene dehydroxylase HpnE [Streptomyces sp. S07_1.15]|uniref:hydroxysqualene dehydroxylase HpnE n=1 Tax=Streptomyces sp. S07_1.15 TaxID=2873925 RepID=UPI001D1586ED|nr:hydroxysqualene dehydroxylase HpnE [Streptomyces sp. S07_1.15]MCC3650785.1 hydroxysqualene dehydroxylase HpnE [Streptomyces sp. S07_1.15]